MINYQKILAFYCGLKSAVCLDFWMLKILHALKCVVFKNLDIIKRNKMKKSRIKIMEEDLKYYDPKNIEFNALIKLTNFKNKKVLDAGCGIARLTLPISRYARNVVGIDIDKNIIRYCRLKKKRRNIKYFLSSIKNFEENEI